MNFKNRVKEVYQQRLTIDAGENRYVRISTTIELRSNLPLGANERAWALIDGERYDWQIGRNTLKLPTSPGEHSVVVKMRSGRRTKEVYNQRLKVNPGQNLRVPIANVE